MPEPGATAKASELFREHVVARYYFATLSLTRPPNAIDSIDSIGTFIPKPSNDSALTAFAQLAALRLNASRCLISLIDSTHQFVLTEATRSFSPRTQTQDTQSDKLWLGSVLIPRSEGICEAVLDNSRVSTPLVAEEVGSDICVINDLQKDPRFRTRAYVQNGPRLRFYAGVPICVSDGTKIGVFCICDDKPRDGLIQEEWLFLKDMATTVSDYLETSRTRVAHQRSEKLVRGLESFVEGSSELKPARSQMWARKSSSTPENVQSDANNLPAERKIEPPPTVNKSISSEGSPKIPLWEQALPQGSRTMFSRAAKIIKQASDLDGVIFYEVSSLYESCTSQSTNMSPERRRKTKDKSSINSIKGDLLLPLSENDVSSTSGNGDRQSSGEEEEDSVGSELCDILGCELNTDTNSTALTFARRDMKCLMGRKPKARAFTLNRVGQRFANDASSTLSSSDSGTLSNTDKSFVSVIGGTTASSTSQSAESGFQRKDAKVSQVAALRKLCPAGRSFICLPLWDYERSRWFATCICWSTSSARDLSSDGDLHYAKIFGNSIMTSLAYLDAREAKQTKTAFTASISHELRSPLHGILGSADFLNDNSLNRFQREMVDSIRNCGRTLLDTVESIMEFSKINNFTEQRSRTLSVRNKTTSGGRPKLYRSQPTSSMVTEVDLSSLVEEVMEAVVIGNTAQHSLMDRISASEMKRKVGRGDVMPVKHRGRVKLALHMAFRESWTFQTQPGAWRRIIMNLFANSLKYTDHGLIGVSLQADLVTNVERYAEVTLKVADTGRGMSAKFLHDHLFQPFTQEDTFQPGAGLGMSIVKQLVQAMGGGIDVTSTQGRGTVVEVKVRLPQSPHAAGLSDKDETIMECRDRLRGYRVCVLHDSAPYEKDHMTQKNRDCEKEYLDALVFLLKSWFYVDASVHTTWNPGSADLIICSEPSFTHLEHVRNGDLEEHPPVLIITYDALEMAALRADVRLTDNISVVEITSQPYGPRKIAGALLQCINRPSSRLPLPTESAFKELSHEKEASTRTSHESTNQETRLPPTPPTEPIDRVDSPSAISVLIVDDNPINRRLLVAYMKREHLFYREAENGKEALELYKARNGAFRYILMDISMPVMDGVTSTRRIREFEKENSLHPTTIIAVTGLASAAARVEAHNAGINQFLTKPVPLRKLTSILT